MLIYATHDPHCHFTRLVLMVVAWQRSQSVVKNYFCFFFARSQLLCKLKDSYCGLMIRPPRSEEDVSIGFHANSTVALTAVIIHPGLSELYEILSINKVNNEDASLRNRRNYGDPTNVFCSRQIELKCDLNARSTKCRVAKSKMQIRNSLFAEKKLSLLERLLNFNFSSYTSATETVFS